MPRWTFLSLIVVAAACNSTAGLKPVRDSDPQAACPGGRLTWSLQITDERAEPRESAQLIALMKDSLSSSFPGCQWTGGSEVGTISIEIYRFSAKLDGAIWDAAAEWDVSVRDAGGQTMTEFEASFEASRPNYRNVNNEKAVLQEVFETAMHRTARGLRAMPPPG